jgi:hypothetical protein
MMLNDHRFRQRLSKQQRRALVFTGFTDGTLVAYDDIALEQVWKFNVGTGFNAPPMTFETGGKQYLVILSGLSAIAKRRHACCGCSGCDLFCSLPVQGILRIVLDVHIGRDVEILCFPTSSPRGKAPAQAALLHAIFDSWLNMLEALLCQDHPKAHPLPHLQERPDG